VDDLPVPVQVDYCFAEYRSTVEIEGNVLRYRRYFRINEVLVPRERLDELKEFFRRIAADELNSAVLRRSAQ
jgi:deoxyhypusine synthase